MALGGRATPRRAASVFAAWAGALVAIAALAIPSGYLSLRLLEDAVLFFAAAPLLLAGAPPRLLRRILAGRAADRVARVLVHPLPAVLTFHILFAISLLAPVAAVEQASPALLAAERLVLLFAALLMWWPLLSPLHGLPRLGTAMQFVYIFVNWLAITAVFGWLLFSAGGNQGGAGVYGLSAAQDQQAGAFALGVVSHVAYAVVGIGAFLRWVRSEHALASPRHLYERVRRAGFDDDEAGEIAGLRGPVR